MDNPDKAEVGAPRGLGLGVDPCDRYESFALLTGLYMDQKQGNPGWTRSAKWSVTSGDDRERRRKKSRSSKPRAAEKAGLGAVASNPPAGRRRRSFGIYLKDPYQFERMIGDYYYGKGGSEKAFDFYESYYRDLDKPVETFVPESTRRYADMLLKRGKTEETLFFIGYIITLKPYMFEDLFGFADLYYGLNDRISALLILMFTHALCEGYSDTHTARCRELVEELGSEMTSEPVGSTARKLAESCLAGEGIPEMLGLVEGLKKEGIRNFFFSYLEGCHISRGKSTRRPSPCFDEFNETYPFLAESHYYELACMFKTDPEGSSRGIVSSAEKAIELKPGCALAEMAKVYLGTTLGIPMNESPKLLISSEIGAIMNGFLQGGPR